MIFAPFDSKIEININIFPRQSAPKKHKSAETGWVELSCKRWLPDLWGFVQGLDVISARSTYRGVFGNLSTILYD